jgi:hypothetical protein
MIIFSSSAAMLALYAFQFLPAVLADFRPFFNNFRAKRAFPRKIPLMNLCYSFIGFFLENFIAEFHISDGLNGFGFTDVSDHFGCF